MAHPTYISSLWTTKDDEIFGMSRDESGPKYCGDVVLKNSIVFPDGSKQESAGVGIPDKIDGGTF